MGKLAVTAGLILLFCTGAARAEPTVTARQLVRTVDTALGDLVEAISKPAPSQEGVDPRSPRSAPFWAALNGLRVRIVMIEGALARRDPELFTLMDQGSTDLGALRVAWARTGAHNVDAARNLRIASASLRALRANFGREGLRLRQGGDLNEAEKRQLARLQRSQRRFAESLQALREAARRRQDAATAAELDRFRREAERIAVAPADLETYLNSLITTSEVRGEWEGNAPYLRDTAPEDFVVANEMIEDLYVESDIGHVFTVDLGTDDGLKHLDDEVAVPSFDAPEAEAVQVFELGGEEVSEEETVELAPEELAPETEEAGGVILEEDLPTEGEGAPTATAETEEGEEKKDVAPAEAGEDVEIEDIEILEPAAPPAEEAEPAKPPAESAAPPPASADPDPKRPPIG